MDNERIVIKGGNRLDGSVSVHGAKNAVLPLLAAAILTKDDVAVENCPYISDVDAMVCLLSELGANVAREDRRICVSGGVTRTHARESLCKTMRSSMFMLGALISATGEVELPLPGGCDIGARPLDIHLDGLRKMGAVADIEGNVVRCSAARLRGADIVMRYPSVGATENLMMCASLAEGDTTLVNCAREPEIVALACGLRAMGAKIYGDGTSVMRIEGVQRLHGARMSAGGDRIAAGTVVAAAALCGGDVAIYGVNAGELHTVLQAFRSRYCDIDASDVCVRVRSQGRISARSVITAPYPLFPTDMQPQFVACQCFSDGACTVRETVFENRFGYAEELKRMGASISVGKNVAAVAGDPSAMKGTAVAAQDLRGGAGLCLAAMKAEGESVVYNPRYIDRGYESFEKLFASLGANIRRISD